MKKIASKVREWERSDFKIFWGEIAPCDHLLQIYENDATFLNTLEGFAASGFANGESVVIIASRQHLNYLYGRLLAQNYDLDTLMFTDQYIPLEAEECLEKFMMNGWPDEKLFNIMVTAIMNRAQRKRRKVRAFGEMVAVLWAQGHHGATVCLENLWHKFQHEKAFCLYCAYPKSGFTEDANASINSICKAHSLVIAGGQHSSAEILYQAAV